MNNRNLVIHYIFSIIFLLCLIVFSTVFIYFPHHENFVGAISYLEKNRSLSLVESSSSLCLTYLYPISDDSISNVEQYNFEVINSGFDTDYQLIFSTGYTDNKLPHSVIHYILIKNDDIISDVSTLPDDGVIIIDTIKSNSINSYGLKFWISMGTDDLIADTVFEGVLQVNAID